MTCEQCNPTGTSEVYALVAHLEKAKREEDDSFKRLEQARRDHDKAVEYRRECQRDLAGHERALEKYKAAIATADVLEKTARGLREHPETFETASWHTEDPRDSYPMSSWFSTDPTRPIVQVTRITTFPQRKVSK